MVDAASEKFMSTDGVSDMSTLADRVLFCVPPGTGTWAASAGMNHWRAQFNDPFCTSLSATMHELGHTIGLPHTNEGSDKYGDSTGYMAASYRNTNWPSRCYNGVNSNSLGWYDSKTLRLSGSESPTLVHLGGIVEYGNATTVLVDIKSSLFLMYNRAKGFNADTGELGDSVTVTETVNGGSDLLAGLRPGETYTYGNVVIEACKRVYDGNPDIMIVSVGKGSSLCSTLEVPAPAPVPSPQVQKANLVETAYPTLPITEAPKVSPLRETTLNTLPSGSRSGEPTFRLRWNFFARVRSFW
jgi:hypothetical protein